MSLVSTAVGFVNPAAGFALKAFGTVKRVLAKLPLWVYPIVAAALVALWAIHGKHVAERKIPALEHKAADSHNAFLLEKQQFAIEKASLVGARAQIDGQNKVIAAQGAALDQATQDAAAARARNTKLAETTDAQIAALQAASHQHKTPCTLSDAARRELEGK